MAEPDKSSRESPAVDPRAIFLLMATLFGLVVGSLLVCLAVEQAFRSLLSRPRPAAQVLPPEPPEPRLQVNPADDLRAMREADQEILGSYGWVDRQRGIVRIPIDRAMNLLIRRGLPFRPASEKKR